MRKVVKRYHVKPHPASAIEAIQWDGTEENAKEVMAWFDKLHAVNESISHFSTMGNDYIMIKSGSFSMTAHKGDYIVRSSKTRSSPKKFSIYSKEAFEAGYYEVETKPVPSSDEALEALRLRLTGA